MVSIEEVVLEHFADLALNAHEYATAIAECDEEQWTVQKWQDYVRHKALAEAYSHAVLYLKETYQRARERREGSRG